MKYLLQNCNAGYIGNSPVFWHKNDSGYTQWIDEAKQWTKEEAERQIQSTKGTHIWKMWSIQEIEAAAKRTVDIQDLQNINTNIPTNYIPPAICCPECGRICQRDKNNDNYTCKQCVIVWCWKCNSGKYEDIKILQQCPDCNGQRFMTEQDYMDNNHCTLCGGEGTI